MNKLLLYLPITLLLGCADYYGPGDYGYEYTDETPMGIRYRVDGAAVQIDPSSLDYYFSSTLNCVGSTYPPENLLVISTTKDANPEVERPAEGWAWGPSLSRPAVIVINTVGFPEFTYPLLTHELVHVFTRHDDHNHEAFDRCGYSEY